MEIQEERQGAVTLLRPIGPLLAADARGFTERVSEAARKSLGRMVVDASALPFVDSAGLEALVVAAEEVGQMGRGLRLCGAGETLREVLDVTDCAGLFEFYQDATDAARSFL